MSLYTRDSARRSLFDTIAFRAASQVATVLGYILLVRGMSRDDFGVFNLLYAFIPVFGMVASFGLEQVLRRYQPEYLRNGDTAAAGWLVRIVSRGRFAINVVLLVVLLLSWEYVAPLFKLLPYRAAFIVFSLLTLLHFQVSILQMALASRMMHRYSVGAVALLSFAKLCIYAVLFWSGALTLQNAIIADTAAYGLSYVVLHLAYRRQSRTDGSHQPRAPDPVERKRLMRYGLFNSFNDTGVLLMSSAVDNFFIAAVIDIGSVAVYGFYTRLNMMAQNLMPQRLFDNLVQPLFFAIPRSEAAAKLPQYFTFLLNMNLLLQWPLLAYSAAYHAELVQVVFGGKYIEFSWLLPVIVGFAAVNVIADPASIVAQYEEKAGIILLSKIFAAYNLLAMVLLVPVLGVLGAVLASGSAALLKNMFIWWHVRGRARWLNMPSAVGCGIVIWGAAALTGSAIRTWVPLPDLLHLIVGVAIMGVAMLVHLRSIALAPSDRNILASVLGGREASILRRLGLAPAT